MFMNRNSAGFHSFDKKSAAYLLANYCTPTLLRLKPASLFNLNKKHISQEVDLLEQLKREMEPFGCCLHILFEDEVRFLIFIYNRDLLSQILYENENNLFLHEAGYEGKELDTLLIKLSHRYFEYRNLGNKFPHEIGLFLGYPLKDVQGFIENNGNNYILCGCWKVYHNAENANRLFQLFLALRREAVHMLQKGGTLKEIKGLHPEVISRNKAYLQ